MKEARIFPGPRVELHEVSFPTLPSAYHLIIEVVVCGSNPKDWAIAERAPGINQGDDLAGIVHAVGDKVTNFRPGDRVAAFHEMMEPHGAFAEYAVAPQTTTFHIPPDVSFEEAATIPLAGLTAAVGMYQRLGLPPPWRGAPNRLPLVVYSAASAVGAFAVKLAMLSNIHPIICVAGRGIPYVQTLIDPTRGDVVIDYRQQPEDIVGAMRSALRSGEKLHYAFDAVSDKGSYQNLMKVMDLDQGQITLVLPRRKYEGIPENFTKSFTQVGKVHSESYRGMPGSDTKWPGPLGDTTFGEIMCRFFERGLREGWFRGHPHRVIPGGLGGLEQGLGDLKAGKASACKFVYRIGDTPDISNAKL